MKIKSKIRGPSYENVVNVRNLLSYGFNKTEVSEMLNLSRQTIHNVINYLKKDYEQNGRKR